MNLIVELRKIQDREIARFWWIGKPINLMEVENYITRLNVGSTPIYSSLKRWLIEKEIKQFIKNKNESYKI